jgi:hypothetical protein
LNQKPFFGRVLAQRSLNEKKWTFQHWLFIIGQHDQVLADWYIFSRATTSPNNDWIFLY